MRRVWSDTPRPATKILKTYRIPPLALRSTSPPGPLPYLPSSVILLVFSHNPTSDVSRCQCERRASGTDTLVPCMPGMTWFGALTAMAWAISREDRITSGIKDQRVPVCISLTALVGLLLSSYAENECWMAMTWRFKSKKSSLPSQLCFSTAGLPCPHIYVTSEPGVRAFCHCQSATLHQRVHHDRRDAHRSLNCVRHRTTDGNCDKENNTSVVEILERCGFMIALPQ
jgi:hypothetical protein